MAALVQTTPSTERAADQDGEDHPCAEPADDDRAPRATRAVLAG